uniref:Uncharacterized protein n=1 Tax=Glossina palpalis gambiensis TaxID=67801 RepID=A0A1B0AUX8_9MUSC
MTTTNNHKFYAKSPFETIIILINLAQKLWNETKFTFEISLIRSRNQEQFYGSDSIIIDRVAYSNDGLQTNWQKYFSRREANVYNQKGKTNEQMVQVTTICEIP